MSVVLFAPERAPQRHQVLQALSGLEPSPVAKSLAQLAKLLPLNGWEENLVVLLPKSAGQLDDLAELPALAGHHRILVVIPDAHPETIAAGHRLRPRVLMISPVRIEELVAVASRMVGLAGG